MILEKHKPIFAIISMFMLIKLISLANYNFIWWDSSVYIGMGKYIYSDAGFWENTRPIIWPLMLGFLLKLGNIIVLVRILEIILGGFCILLTYLIGLRLFEKKTALLASFLLAVSPTFFFFNGIMLTETASLFFLLLGLYLLAKRSYFVPGILFGIAFLTRFLQFIAFASIFMALFYANRQNSLKKHAKVIAGFLIVFFIFLTFNFFMYKNPILPFTEQIILTKNSGWDNYQPLKFYFIKLFNENVFYLLLFFGLLLIIKNNDDKKMLVALPFLALFIFFNFMKQKEMRFLIILMPYMFLLLSFSIFEILHKLTSKKFQRGTLSILILTTIAFSFVNIKNLYENEIMKTNQYSIFQEKIRYVRGKIWVSNPIIAIESTEKISNLMYFPFFDENKKNQLLSNAGNVDFIFMNTCDIACRPDDDACEYNKNELLHYFKKQFRTTYSAKISECEQYIFSK